MNLQKLTKAAKAAPNRSFFSYDPGGSFEIHATAEEAEAQFEKSVDYARDELSDGSADDGISDISWGSISQQLTFTDRPVTPEEKESNPEWDYIREISIDSFEEQSPQTILELTQLVAELQGERDFHANAHQSLASQSIADREASEEREKGLRTDLQKWMTLFEKADDPNYIIPDNVEQLLQETRDVLTLSTPATAEKKSL